MIWDLGFFGSLGLIITMIFIVRAAMKWDGKSDPFTGEPDSDDDTN